MSAEEFGLRPFVAGTVVGLRSFRVGYEGRLTGVVHQLPWEPGENIAQHNFDPPSYLVNPFPEGHRVAGVDCNCGFYAYFGDSNDYGHRYPSVGPIITGIIEAYGTVTIGSRGFRASKGRIIALIRPGIRPDFDHISRKYPGVPVYSTVTEALEAHPTTKPEDVGITPDDTSRPPRYATGGLVASYGTHVHVVHAGQLFAGHGQSVARAAAQLAAAFKQTTQDVQAIIRAAIAETPDDEPAPALGPVELKRAAAQSAADRRAKNGLSNLGGINRRRRNP